MLVKQADNILGAGVVATDSSILSITNEDTSTEISGNEEEEDQLAVPRDSGDNERALFKVRSTASECASAIRGLPDKME